MKLKLLSFFVILFVVLSANAQTTGFRYEAKIGAISESGFYDIVLTPTINAHVQVDGSDLRIVNDSGKWVPHLLRVPANDSTNHSIITSLKITKIESTPAATDLIVATPDSSISDLLIDLKNTQAERYCSLAGSDNLENWFTISDSISIKPVENTATHISRFILKFAPVNYKYFRIHIINNGKEPLNISKVSTNNLLHNLSPVTALSAPAFIENPTCSIIQKDSGNFSYIRVAQKAPYHFNKISLGINAVKYYSRNIFLFLPSSVSHSFSNPGTMVQSFIVSNNQTPDFILPAMNAGIFYLLIQNTDNPPLKIDNVKTYTQYRVATAWLEKAAGYKLIMDNRMATMPEYDLGPQTLSRTAPFPVAEVGTINSMPPKALSQTNANHNKKIIWAIIGIAAIVLAYFTWKLTTDINKNNA